MKRNGLWSGSVAVVVAAGRRMSGRGGLSAPGAGELHPDVLGQELCGDRAELPGVLVAYALLLGDGRPNVEEMPDIGIGCALGRHTSGDHFGFVRELEQPGTDSLWGRWERDSTAVQDLVPMPLCPHKREGGKYLCARIADHQGGHDWQLTEIWILSQDTHADVLLTAPQS